MFPGRAHFVLVAFLSTVMAAAGVLTAPSAGAPAGSATADNAYAFTAKPDIGDGDTGRACSATPVYTDWLPTAAGCFAADPATSLSVPSAQAGALMFEDYDRNSEEGLAVIVAGIDARFGLGFG
ncbi:hypothetical protein ACWC24_31350 [Streptomyces sp. NPDC001443]